MMTKYEQSFRLRASDFDCDMRLHPAAILDLFQEVAGAHADVLGIGFDDMLKKNLIWVVTRIKYRVLKNAAMHENVSVTTWPLPPSRIGFTREYLIKNERGELLIKGTSEWVFMHSTQRRLVPVKDVYPFTDGYCTEHAFDEKTSRIHGLDDADNTVTVIPGFSDIDINGHVNNTKYASFILDALNPQKDDIIDTLQIDYHREVQRGQELRILIKRSENRILAEGRDNENTKMFNCSILLK